MNKALSARDTLKQAPERVQNARATSDPQLRDHYVEVAVHLTCPAALLEKMPGDKVPHDHSEQTVQAE